MTPMLGFLGIAAKQIALRPEALSQISTIAAQAPMPGNSVARAWGHGSFDTLLLFGIRRVDVRQASLLRDIQNRSVFRCASQDSL